MTLHCKLLFSALIYTLLLGNASTTNQHLICKSVDDVFSESTGERKGNSSDTNRLVRARGKSGKRGAVGPQGLPGHIGLKGDAGYVDYNNISDIVKRTVCEELSSIQTDVNDLRADISDMQRTLKELRCSISGLVHNGICYSTPHLSVTHDLSHRAANETCQKLGRKLAEIHDRTQQQILEDFMRSKMPSSLDELELWIGMNYDSATNTILYASGKSVAAGNLVWWPTHPKSVNGNRLMVFGVRRSGGDGLWSHTDWRWQAEGVICEHQL